MESNTEILENRDYKRIYRALGLTPQEWNEIQRVWERKKKEKLFHTGQIHVYSCLCRSPWCPQCSKTCQTAQKIRNRLSILQWDRVRQVVLTVSRDKTPEESMEEIRRNRAIPKLIQALGLKGYRWLWVLEFHKGGYPHWHLFIETVRGKAGLIGKKKIQSLWKRGIVWETYAKSEKHWRAITGYHKKTGYFGAETKQHQLELPNYLREQNRVRKFASNYKTMGEELRKDIIKKDIDKDSCKKRTRQKSYTERLEQCNTKSKIEKDGSYLTVDMPGSQVRELAKKELEQIDYKTYRASREETIDFLIRLFD